MSPGHYGQAQMFELGRAANSGSQNCERTLTSSLKSLGLSLQADVDFTQVKRIGHDKRVSWTAYPVLPIKSLAEAILKQYPEKLLAGHGPQELPCIQGLFTRFWRRYRRVNKEHPVYQDHQNELQWCIPCRIHTDEGTGKMKHPVLQHSWGPFLKAGQGSHRHCFLWASMPHKLYSAAHKGFELGNAVIDSLMAEFAIQARGAYFSGISMKFKDQSMTWYLVWIGHEGDLAAMAKIYHCKRNYNAVPNEMCYWCQGNDRCMPFTDVRSSAAWRATVGCTRPWTVASSLVEIPGASVASCC